MMLISTSRCRKGPHWCQKCKDAAMRELVVKRGFWWNLHQLRAATCDHCVSPDCPAAADHEELCRTRRAAFAGTSR